MKETPFHEFVRVYVRVCVCICVCTRVRVDGKDGPAHAQGNFDWFPWQNGKVSAHHHTLTCAVESGLPRA